MKAKKITPLYVKLGPRENEVLKEFSALAKEGKFPDNKTEISRRGIHSVMRLLEIDESPLLKLLAENLERPVQEMSKEDIELIKALASAIYVIMIAKRGITGAEIFESIPIICRHLDLYGTEKMDDKEVNDTLHAISATIRTLFLHGSEKPSKTMWASPRAL